ncbi:homoserine dehydrogenase [Streptococcus hyovaginalis]|uniref:homoserine dehydrogenase n=1 Tax=Streptococcus hyovaginalis TaxID=149015 RepID=UPI002A8342F6|nr:homoserine dehydrogenase [Streptococcus hyovaginalis]MDY4510177.1 homoserine dehydrogenase [Streptococcus hyovaginalis]
MTVKIGLLGFGTVASGVPYLLQENQKKIFDLAEAEIAIGKVLVKSSEEAQHLVAQGHDYDFVTDVEAILSDESIAIVVELMGRIEPAKTYIAKALQAGKHVVSANKDLIALHGTELLALASENQVSFAYEAAVAGGIPILRTLSQSLISDKITRVLGVLNGTSNYMLTKMVESGWTYQEALESAQALGYAESDPTNDVEGIDAAYKVAILSRFAFGMAIDFEAIHHQGIDVITANDVATAKEMGYVIKLVGDLQETASGLWAEVAPTLIPTNHPLATVNDVMNAVYVESIGIGQSMYYGPGAGQKPTATSVVADIMQISRDIVQDKVGQPFNRFDQPSRLADLEHVSHRYYLSVQARDTTGQLSHLAQLFEKHAISFDQVLQEKASQEDAFITVITHEITRQQLQEVTKDIEASVDFELGNVFKVLGD